MLLYAAKFVSGTHYRTKNTKFIAFFCKLLLFGCTLQMTSRPIRTYPDNTYGQLVTLLILFRLAEVTVSLEELCADFDWGQAPCGLFAALTIMMSRFDAPITQPFDTVAAIEDNVQLSTHRRSASKLTDEGNTIAVYGNRQA